MNVYEILRLYKSSKKVYNIPCLIVPENCFQGRNNGIRKGA